MTPEEQQELKELKESMLTIENKVNKIEKEINKNTVPTHFHKLDRIDFKDLKGGIPTINATPTQVAEQGKSYVHLTNNTLYIKVGDSWKYVALS